MVRAEVDKGVRMSVQDGAFICQKKNHFQVRVHVCMCMYVCMYVYSHVHTQVSMSAVMDAHPCYVATAHGLRKVLALSVLMHAIKVKCMHFQPTAPSSPRYTRCCTKPSCVTRESLIFIC
jgi:hypothetical protein